jgi:hypothetical protein
MTHQPKGEFTVNIEDSSAFALCTSQLLRHLPVCNIIVVARFVRLASRPLPPNPAMCEGNNKRDAPRETYRCGVYPGNMCQVDIHHGDDRREIDDSDTRRQEMRESDVPRVIYVALADPIVPLHEREAQLARGRWDSYLQSNSVQMPNQPHRKGSRSRSPTTANRSPISCYYPHLAVPRSYRAVGEATAPPRADAIP